MGYRPPQSSRKAFTLVELLVVVVIIALLIGLLLPALANIRTRVWRQRATAEARQIVAGIQAYNSDYSRWPVAADYTRYLTDSVFTATILSNIYEEVTDMPMVLRLQQRLAGNYGYSGPLDSAEGSGRSHLTVDPRHRDASNNLCDPWGNVYQVRYDMNDDGQIPNPFASSTSVTVKASVIVWSAGPDKTNDSNGETSSLNRDNIRSW